MCLGVPARVISVAADDVMRMGRVDFGGVSREVSLAYVPEAEVGDYVIVHVGFAISRIDEAEAQRVFELLGEIDPAFLEMEGAQAPPDGPQNPVPREIPVP